jgi:hypothetical protein|tara:strand:+ start:1363 stop:1605 length:243 start_codon:yes stop_codon:yes gene_type:complete
MTQIYSDPSRESDPFALPDVEVFFLTEEQAVEALQLSPYGFDCEAGWFWWGCFNGDFNGPFETEQEAIADARRKTDQEEE